MGRSAGAAMLGNVAAELLRAAQSSTGGAKKLQHVRLDSADLTSAESTGSPGKARVPTRGHGWASTIDLSHLATKLAELMQALGSQTEAAEPPTTTTTTPPTQAPAGVAGAGASPGNSADAGSSASANSGNSGNAGGRATPPGNSGNSSRPFLVPPGHAGIQVVVTNTSRVARVDEIASVIANTEAPTEPGSPPRLVEVQSPVRAARALLLDQTLTRSQSAAPLPRVQAQQMQRALSRYAAMSVISQQSALANENAVTAALMLRGGSPAQAPAVSSLSDLRESLASARDPRVASGRTWFVRFAEERREEQAADRTEEARKVRVDGTEDASI